MSRPSADDIKRSYQPQGFETSASFQRARKPFVTRNFLTGAAVVSFIVGVYVYSISAVKQDDFSDVVDLLPPPAERNTIRTLEDEAREKVLLAEGIEPTAAVALEVAPVAAPPTPSTSVSVLSYLTPKRLSQVEWIQNSGLVEKGKDNLLVWGAPNVDKIGNMREAGETRGRRLV